MISFAIGLFVGVVVGGVRMFFIMTRREDDRMPYKWTCPDCAASETDKNKVFEIKGNDPAVVDRLVSNHQERHA